MATITIDNSAYNNAVHYAEMENLSVNDFIVALINAFATTKYKPIKKFKMRAIEELSPEIQEILSMPRTGQIDADDINGDKARAEYYREKYSL